MATCFYFFYGKILSNKNRKEKTLCHIFTNAQIVMEPMGRAGRKSSLDGIRFKCHECGNGYLEKTDCMVEID